MAGLTVRDVSKSFDDEVVLHDLTLDVADGTTVALLGPSGSGKSTLLRIIAGLEVPDAGSIRIDGADVTRMPPHRRSVGVVFQDQALFPHLDVGGNVGFGLRMGGVGRAARRSRVSEALALVGLRGFEGRDPATLSGGEAQRVALARALAPRPQLVLLDEPFAALDQLLREHLLLELRSIFDELGVTVVAVTHDPTEAGALGERMAVLLDGRIAQIAEPGDVLARPCSAEVAGLVGQRNVVPGDVSAGWLTCAWGRFPVGEKPDGPVDVLVQPDGVHASEDGLLAGTVTGLIFRGGSAFAVVAGDDWPALDVRAGAGWRPGDGVCLAIDPAAVHVMAR
ncbi:MAG: ABC transporter ATP-binding protein [Acidimicrobiales bacterium]